MNGKITSALNLKYVEGVVVPSRLQVKNYTNNTLKPKQAKTNFSYADLAEWVVAHRDVPDDENEPFVIDDNIFVNDLAPKSSTIRLAISTKKLLSQTSKRKHMCADAITVF